MSDNDNGVNVTRERVIVQKETLTVKSKRGTGTNDRDEVRKHVEREAEVDVPEDMLEEIPSLIGRQEQARVVGEVGQTMADLRETNSEQE